MGTHLVDLYNVRSIPHAVLIDKNGKIIAEKISIKTLEKELENFRCKPEIKYILLLTFI